MIVYCSATYLERKDQTLEGLKRIAPHVDRCVIVAPEPQAMWADLWETPREGHIDYFSVPWTDDFPKYRNEYLKHVDVGDWVIVADPDEHFSQSFCKDIRQIIAQAERENVELILINSHDIYIDEKGKRQETISNFFKNLIFKYSMGVRYEGVGEAKNVHETLQFGRQVLQMTLPRQYYYEHVKRYWEVWERAARNVFIGGGGNNVGSRNPQWSTLRHICADLGINTWERARDYFRKGNVDKRLIDWMAGNNFDGFDWEHEMAEFGRWYFEYLHPEESERIEGGWKMVTEVKTGSPAEIMRFVEETYLRVMGRHADDQGKVFYAQAIMENRMKRQDLEATLKQSGEYQTKFQGGETRKPETESISVPVPVDVRVQLQPDTFNRAVIKSANWAEMLTELTLAKKFNAYLAIQRKVETAGKGADEEPMSTFTRYVDHVKDAMPPIRNHHLLEVGAGAGDETKALIDAGYSVVGITFGADNIRSAEEKYGIKLLAMDMHNLEFPQGFFDGVIIVHTLEHAISPHMVVGEIRWVLRDGGRVYVAVPDSEAEQSKTIWHTNLLMPNQIVELFEYWGFRLIDMKEMGKSRHSWDKWEFVFEKIPANDPTFKNYGYLQHIFALRGKLP